MVVEHQGMHQPRPTRTHVPPHHPQRQPPEDTHHIRAQSRQSRAEQRSGSCEWRLRSSPEDILFPHEPIMTMPFAWWTYYSSQSPSMPRVVPDAGVPEQPLLQHQPQGPAQHHTTTQHLHTYQARTSDTESTGLSVHAPAPPCACPSSLIFPPPALRLPLSSLTRLTPHPSPLLCASIMSAW